MRRYEYRLIQFLLDPIKEEGRNIGVIAFNGSWAGFRLIGMIEGIKKPDLSLFISVLDGDKDHVWVFGEWIEWFRSLCSESEGNSEIIHSELNFLENHSPQFSATRGGELVSDADEPESILSELFKDLIRLPKPSSKPEFQEQLEKALIRSEIPFRSGYEEDIEVTLDLGDSRLPIVFTLDYYIEGERKAGIKVIKFHRARASNLGSKINDAIYTFSQAQTHSFIDKEKCIVLCDSPSESKMSYVDRLAEVATVIDITKDGASGKIARACA